MLHLSAAEYEQHFRTPKDEGSQFSLAASDRGLFQVIADLEEERRKHAEDTAEGDDVTYILEKERERLHQQVTRNQCIPNCPVEPLLILSRIFGLALVAAGI